MTQATIDRVALLEEARALEQVGGTWRVRHVCAVLDIHRATLARIAFLTARKEPRGTAGVCWRPSTVRLYQTLQSARDPLAHREAV